MQEIFFYLGQYCTIGIRLKEFQKCLIQLTYPIFQELCFIVNKKLFPVLNSFYKRYQSKIINICTTREENNFIGDGQSDSPGYSTKYGTYSLISTDLNKIVLQGIQVEWKRKGFKLCLKIFKFNKNNYTDN